MRPSPTPRECTPDEYPARGSLRSSAQKPPDGTTNEDSWEKGLQLAYFIVPERAVALDILRDAVAKLEVQFARERKRRYWRDKSLKGKIRRISRDEMDAFQWLVYFESEAREKTQEDAGKQTPHDMVVHYIKHLVQITTAMSSLYVHIGLHRLLYDYTTPEVRQIYEWITGHHPGHAEYRKVKGALMERLQTRFEPFIRVCTGDRRELKFEPAANQEMWNAFVDHCLETFVPWSTVNACPSLAILGNRWTQLLHFLSVSEYHIIEQDTIETRRCHTFIDPACYGEITRQLGMDHQHKRLVLPMFFMNAEHDRGSDSRTLQGEARHLTSDERTALTEHLHTQANIREQMSPALLTFIAHGNICAHIDLTRDHVCAFPLPNGTKLIEIWGEDQSGKALLATHWIRYQQWQGIAAQSAMLSLPHKMQLLLRVTPCSPDSESDGALVHVEYGKRTSLARAKHLIELPIARNLHWLKYTLAGVLLAASLAVGWFSAKARYQLKINDQSAKIEQMKKELADLQSQPQTGRAGTTATELIQLIPDSVSTREHGESEPVVSVPPEAGLLLLELPISEHEQFSYLATLTGFLDSREILSEDGLIPQQIGGRPMVIFTVPTSVVHTSGDYVVHLYARTHAGHVQRPLNFTFYIEKN